MMSIAALLKALLAVGVDCLFIMFADEPPEPDVGVATAEESALLPLRCELASGPAFVWDVFVVVNTRYIKALAVSRVQLTPKANSTF